jgi:hypothetical protein
MSDQYSDTDDVRLDDVLYYKLLAYQTALELAEVRMEVAARAVQAARAKSAEVTQQILAELTEGGKYTIDDFYVDEDNRTVHRRLAK